MPQRPTYAQAVAGAALNAQVRKQQLTECAQILKDHPNVIFGGAETCKSQLKNAE